MCATRQERTTCILADIMMYATAIICCCCCCCASPLKTNPNMCGACVRTIFRLSKCALHLMRRRERDPYKCVPISFGLITGHHHARFVYNSLFHFYNVCVCVLFLHACTTSGFFVLSGPRRASSTQFMVWMTSVCVLVWPCGICIGLECAESSRVLCWFQVRVYLMYLMV